MSGARSSTIKRAIRRKIDSWLETIEDKALRQLVSENVIVTGGCIASMLLGEKVSDFDVYFRTKETTRQVADYYVAKWLSSRKKRGGVEVPLSVEELIDSQGRDRIRVVVKSAGVDGEAVQNKDYQYFEFQPDGEAEEYVQDIQTDESDTLPKHRPVFFSSNAITLHGDIQLILRFHGGPEQIHENFDFQHCMCWWSSWDGHLELPAASLECLLSRTLVYRGSLYPVSSVFRVKKFLLRGWKISAGQQLKMLLQVSKLDLERYDVLEEQLTGVDVAFFSQLLSLARNKENPERVDAAYISAIIDRMF